MVNDKTDLIVLAIILFVSVISLLVFSSITGLLIAPEQQNYEPSSCFDSDGGKIYFVKGNVIAGTNRDSDECINANQLKELFCINDALRSEIISCERGCNNDACTRPPVRSQQPSPIQIYSQEQPVYRVSPREPTATVTPTNNPSYTVTTSSPTFRAESRQSQQDNSAQRRRNCINNCESRMRQCANNCEPNPFTQWSCIGRCTNTRENCLNDC